MLTKRILTVQDISCVGQCSLTVALPIISACGIETAILPSAVLSTHTGGFKGFTFCDLTDEMPKILRHWQSEGIKFDALYTGYLGSARQIQYVLNIADTVLSEGAPLIVDPAMADNGKLYYGFDSDFVKVMAQLVARADVTLPNVTEASLLTDTEYRESYGPEYVEELIQKLTALGAKQVVMTGTGFRPEETGVTVYADGVIRRYTHKKFAKGSHGTGDIYAASFTGALMRGKEIYDAAVIAANYTLSCIEETKKDPEHWYGAVFETSLPKLIASLA